MWLRAPGLVRRGQRRGGTDPRPLLPGHHGQRIATPHQLLLSSTLSPARPTPDSGTRRARKSSATPRLLLPGATRVRSTLRVLSWFLLLDRQRGPAAAHLACASLVVRSLPHGKGHGCSFLRREPFRQRTHHHHRPTILCAHTAALHSQRWVGSERAGAFRQET